MKSETILTWRPLNQSDGKALTLLLDRAFGLIAPASYLNDFPVWDSEIPLAHQRFQVGGFLGDDLVCTASARFSEYRFLDGRVEPFAFIGGVATHPEFLKRGYGSQAIDRLFLEGISRNIKSYALWGADHSLYRKNGFKFSGRQVRVPLRSIEIPRTLMIGFEVRSGWEIEIFEHFLKRKSGVIYHDRDLLWLSEHKNVEWRSFWSDGKCLAYCAWNRGIDLPNIIHEIDGELGAVVELLRFLKVRYPNLEWMVHPNALKNYGITSSIESTEEYLAQLRLDEKIASRVDEIWFSGMDSC